MRTTIILALTQLTLVVAAKPARSDWLPVLSGPIARVVAAGRQVAALRNGEVLILREDGNLLSRSGGGKGASHPTDSPSARQVAEETLDRLEIPEIDRGTEYTDELVDGESRLGQRRSWRDAGRSAPEVGATFATVLAASAPEIWIGNARGIYRVGNDGEVARAFGREWQGPRMAAAARWLLIDHGGTLALLPTGDSGRRIIQLASPAEHIAISASGERVAWAAGTDVHILGPDGKSHHQAASPVVDLAFCGETAVALLRGGVLAIPPDGKSEMRAAPPEARRLTCAGGDALPWLVLGQGLWASSDRGRHWVLLPTPDGPALLDLAISDHHAWLATSTGLFASVDATVPGALRPAMASALRRPVHRTASWLAWFMPKLSLRAAVAVSPNGHQIEGFAYAALPLGSQAAPARPSDPSPTAPAIEPVRIEVAAALPDAEASCLPVARRKAVELAMTEPERARSYVSRAGHAAWLPELRALVSRRYGRSESLDIAASSSATASPLGIDTVNDIRYEVRATWDLAKLVFSSEELAAQSQALHMAELRRDIETTVNRLYFERRRLRVAPAAPNLDGTAERIRSQEVEAELDALSGGAFAACVSEKSTGAR
jgi:hypothetical protein